MIEECRANFNTNSCGYALLKLDYVKEQRHLYVVCLDDKVQKTDNGSENTTPNNLRLMIMDPHKTYAFLALLLSPWKRPEQRETLKHVLRADPPWSNILYATNKYNCAPFLFKQLRSDNLHNLIPDPILSTLKQAYQFNSIRTMLLVQTLKEIAQKLNSQEIPFILLKGAATFTDNLYGDPATRAMSDLDIQVQPKHLKQVARQLADLGYKIFSPENILQDICPETIKPDPDDHHLPPFYNKKTNVAVEIHYTTHHNWAGALLPNQEVWQQAIKTSVAGEPVRILSPEHRLYHNVTHAMIGEHSYIRTQASLRNLLEFCYLTEKYPNIDWDTWLTTTQHVELDSIFKLYIKLAQTLFFMPLSKLKNKTSKWSSRIDREAHRFINAGNLLTQPPEQKTQTLWLKIRYYRKLPLWMWKHGRYSKNGHLYSKRITLLLKKIISKKSRNRGGY